MLKRSTATTLFEFENPTFFIENKCSGVLCIQSCTTNCKHPHRHLMDRADNILSVALWWAGHNFDHCASYCCNQPTFNDSSWRKYLTVTVVKLILFQNTQKATKKVFFFSSFFMSFFFFFFKSNNSKGFAKCHGNLFV